MGADDVEAISQAEMGKDPLKGSDESVYYECRMAGRKARELIGYRSQFDAKGVRSQLKEAVLRLAEERRHTTQ